MRFTSLIVELVRARPRLVFWVVVLLQAAVWFILPVLLYASPPGDMATVLAFGREYQVGTHLGPPLAFWAADIAFRLTGNHVFGVYLLAQICFVVTFWALFSLSRAIVGGQQAILVVLLTVTIFAFSSPGAEFGPATLARPIWALILLHAWQVMGQGRRNAWFKLSLEIGLLLLTTHAAMPLLAMLIVFALATRSGRRAILSTEALSAILVVAVLVLPYAIWLARANPALAGSLPSPAELSGRLKDWGGLLGSLVFSLSGLAVLLLLNSRWTKRQEEAPVIYRPSVDSFARDFVLTFAIAPPVVLSLIAAFYGRNQIIGGNGIALLIIGLAVIVVAGDLIHLRRQQVLRTAWLIVMALPVLFVLGLTFIQPWTGSEEMRTAQPAKAIGRFFEDSYSRRVGRPLTSVAGDPQLAALIGFGAAPRPHVFFDAQPEYTPWLTAAKFTERGGVVVWRAADTAGTPPADIQNRFPGLVSEVPRAFDPMVKGRQDALRVGWAIVRPENTQTTK
ncbi:MAG: glycosyltransferase family 39 protein [Afipia sp.]|nr:glycosyltransferase family 39 protein [Afipia sp.]